MNLIGIDLDGTLEDSRADMAAAVHRVRSALGIPLRDDESVLPWVNKGMDGLYRACFDDYLSGDESRMEEVRKRYEADYLEHVAVKTFLYPGIFEALERLAEMGRLAVITNKPEKISIRLLEALGVDRHIDAVVGGDSCAKTKPDPMVLEEAARRSGLSGIPDLTVMIGDTAGDIRLGRASGAATIWCGWGYMDEPGEEPDYIAARPPELPGLVDKAFKVLK